MLSAEYGEAVGEHARSDAGGQPFWRTRLAFGRWSGPRVVSRRRLQVILGWLWLLDALLQAEPPNFSHSYPLGDLAQSVMGAPAWENHLIYHVIGPFVAHWPWWNLGAVLVQAAIGIALVRGRVPRLALGLSIAWSAVVWLVGEGLGTVPSGFGLAMFGAPGPAVLYALLAMLAWPTAGQRDVSKPRWTLAWTAAWGTAAALQVAWVYPVAQSWRANFEEVTLGQTNALATISRNLEHAVLLHPLAASVALGVAQAALALGCLLDPVHLRWWLTSAIGLCLVYWISGQMLGGILTWGATDVGTAPLLAALALAAWPKEHRTSSELVSPQAGDEIA